MKQNEFVVGDILLELKEAEEVGDSSEESIPLTITQDWGTFLSLICC